MKFPTRVSALFLTSPVFSSSVTGFDHTHINSPRLPASLVTDIDFIAVFMSYFVGKNSAAGHRLFTNITCVEGCEVPTHVS